MRSSLFACVTALAAAFVCLNAMAVMEDLGHGFMHHGVATPISNHRGTVATVDGDGRDVALVWLFDCRGGYALLCIDAETGSSKEYPMPFEPGGDCPYASILSSKNKFYTHFNSHFAEFDPVTRAFTFEHATTPQMAMSMTEDDQGVIWSVTYPNSGVVSYDPKTKAFKDYGLVHAENWPQYQRSVAADDSGWLYFGVGNTASQIIVFDPKTGAAKAIVPQESRITGTGVVVRDNNGKVYGQNGNDKVWYELYKGESKTIPKPERIDAKPIITSSQGLFHTPFPSGKILKTCDLTNRTISVENPKTGEIKELRFEYSSEGADIMGVAAAPDGTLCGGTAFPMRFFSYNPATDAWINRDCYSQWNTVVRQGDRFFAGGYPEGFLLEWDPAASWVPTEKAKPGCNPLFLGCWMPDIYRPHELLAHPDGNTLILAGTPGYGYTGGGLLFWDRANKSSVLIKHTEILPEHSTLSLVALPNGKLLGGSTTDAGTGGERKAKEAELYILDMATKKIEWHAAVFPGVQGYTDLYMASEGLVYGVADCQRFFVFDPGARKVLQESDLMQRFGRTVSQQGPRVFVQSPKGPLYMLFEKGIAQVDLKTHALQWLADSPVHIALGGDYFNGRLYFGNTSHLYSYAVPNEK